MSYNYAQLAYSKVCSQGRTLRQIEEALRLILPKLDSIPALPVDASAAYLARMSAQARGWFTAEEFARATGRGKLFIMECTRGRTGKALKFTVGAKGQVQIPLGEWERWYQL